jgi:DNA-directed RNA polymerase subunit RPC12/RpoP
MEQETCKKCGSKNIVMVEYSWDSPEHYDGISEIQCNDCGVRIGRWSGKELAEGECEKRYGMKK